MATGETGENGIVCAPSCGDTGDGTGDRGGFSSWDGCDCVVSKAAFSGNMDWGRESIGVHGDVGSGGSFGDEVKKFCARCSTGVGAYEKPRVCCAVVLLLGGCCSGACCGICHE